MTQPGSIERREGFRELDPGAGIIYEPLNGPDGPQTSPSTVQLWRASGLVCYLLVSGLVPSTFLIFLARRFSLMDLAAFFRVGLLTDFSDIPLLISRQSHDRYARALDQADRPGRCSSPSPTGQDAPQAPVVPTRPSPTLPEL
jgi:hypothetical protein